VSLQFSILKVLAGQPDGRATVSDLNRYITLLSCPEWTARMRRLSSRAPDLDIFGSRYVLRDQTGWQLTEAGHTFLAGIENSIPAMHDPNVAAVQVILKPTPRRQSATPTLRLVADNQETRRPDPKVHRTQEVRVA
jgi:hypothetical protein